MKRSEFAPAVSHTSGWLLCYPCIYAQHLELFAVAEIMTKLFMLTKEKNYYGRERSSSIEADNATVLVQFQCSCFRLTGKQ